MRHTINLTEVVSTTQTLVLSDISDEWTRAQVLTALAPHLASQTRQPDFPAAAHWHATNRTLTHCGRPGYLESLAALMPWLEALVNRYAADPQAEWQSILEGIRAAEWWP